MSEATFKLSNGVKIPEMGIGTFKCQLMTLNRRSLMR